MNDSTQTLIKSTRKLGDNVLDAFQKVLYHVLSMRTKCNYFKFNKSDNKKNRSPACYHVILREGLIKTGISSLSYDKKWGRFTPDCRFNVDQVPMLFAIDCKTTCEVNLEKEDKRNHPVWLTNSGSGLEKRQCTLKICFSPESKVCTDIIFRETDNRVSGNEIEA